MQPADDMKFRGALGNTFRSAGIDFIERERVRSGCVR